MFLFNSLIFLLTNPLFYVMVLIILGGIFGFLGFILGLKALVDVRALQKSTHSVQYMPVDPKDLDGWATDPDALDEQNKLFRKDLEEQFPELVPSEEERKKYSF